MKKTCAAAAVALALAGAAMPALAQQWKTVEVGVHVQRTMFGDVLRLDDAFGFGGHLGFFILPNLAVEGDISFAPTEGPLSGDITFRPVYAQLVYNIPLSQRFRLLAGAGYGFITYSGDETDNEFEEGFHALGGFRYYLAPYSPWSIRAELIGDKMPSPANQVQPIDKDGYWNTTVRLGLAWQYPTERCVVDISPARAEISDNASQSFTVTTRGEKSGRPRNVATTLTVSPSGSISGNTFGPAAPGTYTVTASGKGCANQATSVVTVAPRLVGIALAPKTSTVKAGESVDFTVTGRMSDNTSRTLSPSEAQLTGSGGTISGFRYTAGSTAGTFPVRAAAGALTDDASVTVTVDAPPADNVTATVFFDLGKANLRDDARTELDRVAQVLQTNPSITIRVAGHADTIPPRAAHRRTKAFNDSLALARADTVAAYLLNKNIESARFAPTLTGFGFCAPRVAHVSPTEQPGGEQQNRRVHIVGQSGELLDSQTWSCPSAPTGQPTRQKPVRP